LSVEGLVIEPSTSLPVRAFGFRLWPPEAGIDSSDLSERSNSAPALRECRTSLSCCHSAESVSRRTQDDIATGTRTLNGSAHCVRSIQPCLCFERRGLNQAGGSFRGIPTCFKPLSESLSRIYLLVFPAGTMRELPCAPAFVLAIENDIHVLSKMQEVFS
jgi:hypothetical protein